jgi:predicted RNase H-like HicB family nuclease
MRKLNNTKKDPKALSYAVIIRKTATGYSADAPDVLGCIAAAKTLNGTRRLMAEALYYHFEMMKESGEKIPMPRPIIEFSEDEADEETFCTWIKVKKPKHRTSA